MTLGRVVWVVCSDGSQAGGLRSRWEGRRQRPAGGQGRGESVPTVRWDCGVWVRAEFWEDIRMLFRRAWARGLVGVRHVAHPTAPFSSPADLPSVMLLNGDCPESFKKEEGAAEPLRENGLEEAELGEETPGQEVIVIQDTGFSVKILAPGIEPFSLQVRREKCAGDQGPSLALAHLSPSCKQG